MYKNDFSIEGYKKKILLFQNLGFKFSLSANLMEKNILMRHDIDLNLKISVKMSQIEKNMGVNSIYCIMVRNPLYSIDTEESWNHLHEIIANGHEIGLHYDPAIETMMSFDRQMEFLEMKTQRSIRYFSQHQPIKHGLKNNLSMKKYINLYSPMYVKEYKYISDSCMKPREDISKAVERYDRIQYLTHPEFWIVGGLNLDEFKLKIERKFEIDKKSVLETLIDEMKRSIRERNLIDSEILGN